jgi:hypothetical protein
VPEGAFAPAGDTALDGEVPAEPLGETAVDGGVTDGGPLDRGGVTPPGVGVGDGVGVGVAALTQPV